MIWSLFNGFYWYLSSSILSYPEYPIQSNEGGKGLSFELHYMHGVTMMCSAHCNRYLLNGRHLFKGLDSINQLLLSKTILFTHSPADLNYSTETCMIHVRAP